MLAKSLRRPPLHLFACLSGCSSSRSATGSSCIGVDSEFSCNFNRYYFVGHSILYAVLFVMFANQIVDTHFPNLNSRQKKVQVFAGWTPRRMHQPLIALCQSWA